MKKKSTLIETDDGEKIDLELKYTLILAFMYLDHQRWFQALISLFEKGVEILIRIKYFFITVITY